MNEPHDEILDKANDILHSNDSKIYGKEPRTLPLPSFPIYIEGPLYQFQMPMASAFWPLH